MSVLFSQTYVDPLDYDLRQIADEFESLQDQIDTNKELMQSTDYSITDNDLKELFGSSSTLKSILKEVKRADYIIEQKVVDGTTIEKWASGKMIKRRREQRTIKIETSAGGFYVSPIQTLALGGEEFVTGTLEPFFTATVIGATYQTWGTLQGFPTSTQVKMRAASTQSMANGSVMFNVMLIGRWKSLQDPIDGPVFIGGEMNVQSDWDEVDIGSDAYIKNKPTVAPLSNSVPLMNGTASAGSAGDSARSNHVHPTDTSRASVSTLTAHTGNTDVHVSAVEKDNWNAKMNLSPLSNTDIESILK